MRPFNQKLLIPILIATVFSVPQIQRANAQLTDASGLPISTDGFAGPLQNRFKISSEIPSRWLNIAKFFGVEQGAIDQLLDSAVPTELRGALNASLGIPDLAQLTANITQGNQDQAPPTQLAAALEN